VIKVENAGTHRTLAGLATIDPTNRALGFSHRGYALWRVAAVMQARHHALYTRVANNDPP